MRIKHETGEEKEGKGKEGREGKEGNMVKKRRTGGEGRRKEQKRIHHEYIFIKVLKVEFNSGRIKIISNVRSEKQGF